MRIVIADDETKAVRLLRMILNDCPLINQETDMIFSFTAVSEVLSFFETQTADLVFLDIEMPVMNGLQLADKIRSSSQVPPEIVFITAFPQYALDAWSLPAAGYILKPYDPQQIYELLIRLQRLLPAPEKKHLHMRCFPQFEVFIDDAPVIFQSKKAKELLALLVHFRGSWVDLDRITFNLFEYMEEHSAKNYCRTILHRLRRTLEAAGYPDLVENKYGKIRVKTENFTCDYYDYLDGNTDLFQGEYLSEYSWAEPALSAMLQKMNTK